MWRRAVDVGSHDIGLDLVGFDPAGDFIARGVDHVEQPPGPGVVAKPGESHCGPNRSVGVLAAIFPYSRYVTLDIAGLKRASVEGRIEQQYRACVGAYQVLLE
ncbi:hypothetical protein D3C73_1271030 [compost metagenome]